MHEFRPDDYLISYPHPSDPDFYSKIEAKKEFAELTYTLDESQTSDTEHGEFLKYQELVFRYLMFYDRLYIQWMTGTGKSVSIMELLKRFHSFRQYNDETVVWNYLNNKHPEFKSLVYIGGNEMNLKPLRKIAMKNAGLVEQSHTKTEKSVNRGTTTVLGKFYVTMTIKKFITSVSPLSEETIVSRYDNSIIVIDEVHNLRLKPEQLEYVFASPTRRKEMESNGEIDLGSEITKKGESDRTKFQTVLLLVSFLDKIPRKKIIIMSATPLLKDHWEFILSMNLLLDKNDRLEVKEYNLSDKNTYQMLVNKFRGMVSFVDRRLDNVNIQMVGDPLDIDPTYEEDDKKLISIMRDRIKDFGDFRVYPVQMQGVQGYSYVYRYGSYLDKKKFVPFNTDLASVSGFVYPNGEYNVHNGQREYMYINTGKTGKQGKINHIRWTWRPLTMLERRLDGPDFFEYYMEDKIGKVEENGVITYKQYNFRDLSVKIDEILKTSKEIEDYRVNTYGFNFGTNLIISEFVENGVMPIAFKLDAEGYKIFKEISFRSKVDGSFTIDPEPRYALLVKQTPKSVTGVIQDLFNHPDNYDGKYIKFIVISKIASEGLSFHHVTNTFVLKPFWLYPKLIQALSRGIRTDAYTTLRKILDNSPVSVRLKILRDKLMNPEERTGTELDDMSLDIIRDEVSSLEQYTPTEGLTIESRIYLYVAYIKQDENGYDESVLTIPPEGDLVISPGIGNSYIPSIDRDLVSRSLQRYYFVLRWINFMRWDLTFDRTINRYRNESPDMISQIEEGLGIQNPKVGVTKTGTLRESNPMLTVQDESNPVLSSVSSSRQPRDESNIIQDEGYKRKYIQDNLDESSYNLFYSQDKYHNLAERMKLLFLYKNSYSSSFLMSRFGITYQELIQTINYVMKNVIIFRQYDGRPGSVSFENNILTLVSSSEKSLPLGRSREEMKAVLYPKSLARFVAEHTLDKSIEIYPENELKIILSDNFSLIKDGWKLRDYIQALSNKGINIKRFGREILQYKLVHEPIEFSSAFKRVTKNVQYSTVSNIYKEVKDGRKIPVILYFILPKYYKKMLSLVSIIAEHRSNINIFKGETWREPLDKEYILYSGILHEQMVNRWRSDIRTEHFPIIINDTKIFGRAQYNSEDRSLSSVRIRFNKPLSNISKDSLIDILWIDAPKSYVDEIISRNTDSLDELQDVGQWFNISLDDNLVRLRFYKELSDVSQKVLAEDVDGILNNVLVLDRLDI